MKANNYHIGSQLAIILVKVLLLVVFCCNTETALSQFLKGRVYENNTGIALEFVGIKVASGTEATHTDKNGYFKIKANINDLLIITAFGYKTDTLLLTNMNFREVYLVNHENLLNEVQINSSKITSVKKTKSYDPDFHNQTLRKQLDDKGNYKGGVVLRFWYWKKDEKKKRKIEQVLKADSAYRKIREVFSRDTILKYLPLKNDELDGFISRYLPSIESYTSPAFNLVVYLNDCYKEFKVLTKEERIKRTGF